MTAPQQPPQPSGWPLFVMAGSSFIPVLGIFFGAVAIPWGLVSRRRRARLAAALGAAGVFLNFAAGVALVVRSERDPALVAAVAAAQATMARRDLVKLIVAIDQYHARTGHYPSNLPALVGWPVPVKLLEFNIYDHTTGKVDFPQRMYEYTVASDSGSFDLFAVGRDGLPHTADDIRAELPDSVRRNSGYRPAR